MKPFLASAYFVLVLPCAFYGWGLLLRRCAKSAGRAAITTTLGLALAVFFGGLLNLFGIAYPFALGLVLVIGLCLFLLLRPPSITGIRTEVASLGPLGLAIAGVFALFLLYSQVPASIYNIFDDFEKYFTWPTRMLATGSVTFSPLSALGAESLGGQAFLQGFALAFFPAPYIGAIDRVFGMLLCLWIALSLTENWKAQVLAVLAVIVIDPQIINIATNYIGAAIIMAVFALSAEPEDRPVA